MKILRLCLLLFAALYQICSAEADEQSLETTHLNEEKVKLKISPKCASVLLASGTALGAGMMYILTPAALCTAGFCSTGVTGGSFAAWWQSTMPMVVKGSLFASLQSIAMGGSSTTTAVVGTAIGGVIGATYVEDFCRFVDETDPDSAMGITFGTSHDLVTGAIKAKDDATAACASSETCTRVSDTVQEAMSVASNFVSWGWDSIKSAASSAAGYAQLRLEILKLEGQIKEAKNEFGAQAFELIRSVVRDGEAPANLKDILDKVDAGIRLVGLINIFNMFDAEIRLLEEDMKEKQSKDLDSSVRSIERKINAKKEEFGIHAFDYLQGRWMAATLAPRKLEEIYQQCVEKVKALQPHLEEKQRKLNDGEF